jgi:hypothetical protein
MPFCAPSFSQAPAALHFLQSAHPPQFNVPPQPLPTMPQVRPNSWHVLGTHTHLCSLLQVMPSSQPPQLIGFPPHPGSSIPHW